MGFEKDQGACTGRGFSGVDGDGFLKNLHDFVTGHADWSIILDRSALPSQKTCTDADGATEIITCAAHGYKNGEVVRVQDVGNGIPTGLNSSIDYTVGVESANTFKLYLSRQHLQSGTEINIGNLALNFGVTRMEPYILISNNGTPANANVLESMMKWGYHTEEAGYVFGQCVLSYDTANEEIVFIYDGMKISTLDAAAFVYDFRANDLGLFYVQSQISGTWKGFGVDEFSPLTNYLESPATISGTAQTSLSNGANVVVQVTDAAEANLFTNGEWYYVYDFRYDAVVPLIAVAYGECNGVGVADGLNADEIRFATLNNDFNTGAKLSPYPFPIMSVYRGAQPGNSGQNDFRDSGYYGQIPFYGRSDGTTGHYCIFDQYGDIQGAYRTSREDGAMLIAAPDDKGNYTVQRPLVCELYRPGSADITQMNRPYGECKNIYIVDDNGLNVMTTGRTIDSKEHIHVGEENEMFFLGSSLLAVLMINEA